MRRLLAFTFARSAGRGPGARTGAGRAGRRPAVRARHRAAPGRRYPRRDRRLQGRARLAPDRVDALSNLGAAYVRLGQYDEAIKQYEAALKRRPAQQRGAPQPRAGVLQVGAPQRGHPAAQARDRRPTRGEERVPACSPTATCRRDRKRKLVSLLKPREQMFGGDLAFAYLLGTALLRLDDVVAGQDYVDRVFGAGESAEAHLLLGHRALRTARLSRREDRARGGPEAEPALPTAHCCYGRALMLLGEPDASERAYRQELEINQRLRRQPAARQPAQVGAAIRRGVHLSRARHPDPPDRSRGAPAARQPAAADRHRTRKRWRCSKSVAKEAPDAVEVHVQLATAYNRLKRKEDADRERAIVDRLNAEVAAKQKGGDDDAASPVGRRRDCAWRCCSSCRGAARSPQTPRTAKPKPAAAGQTAARRNSTSC